MAIGIPECRGYTDARRKLGASDSTARRELKVLRAAGNHALRWKRITRDQMPTFELPAEDDDGQEVRWFSQAELDLLLSRAEAAIESAALTDKPLARAQRLQDFIILTYWWGARRSSVEMLEVGQVQLNKGVVNLQKPGERATKKRRPIVPIFPAQREVLERRVAGSRDGWLFGRNYTSYRPFLALCEQCGFDEGRRNPHMLRHSRATHMLMAGESIYKVGRLLGDSVTTIDRVYGHHSPEFLAS